MVLHTSKEIDDSQMPEVVEEIPADHVFLLMKKEYRISRNIRAEWYLNHINGSISISPHSDLASQEEELRVISIVPPPPADSSSTSKNAQPYHLTTSSHVTFLSQRYRLVFCLDFSPSIAFMDDHQDKILSHRIFTALEKCLASLIQPFYIPGSSILFQPELFITVIAYMPFCSSRISQVLVQGWPVTSDNLQTLLNTILSKLHDVENIVATTCMQTDEVRDRMKLRSEKLTGALFEDEKTETSFGSMTSILNSPDINTVDMLRFGLLALQLLPENSCAGVVVISDGIVTVPGASMLQRLLAQLRSASAACSFIQVGPGYLPQAAAGQVPHSDLMAYLALATNGVLLQLNTPFPPESQTSDNETFAPNDFHKAFFWWDFHYSPKEFTSTVQQSNCFDHQLAFSCVISRFNHLNLGGMQGLQHTRVRQLQGDLATSLVNIMSCRLREGFFLSKAAFIKGRKTTGGESGDSTIEITFVLPCRLQLIIEYKVTTSWPPKGCNQTCHYEVTFEGLYELISDIVNYGKEKIKSPYRSTLIDNFWNIVNTLNQTDQLLVHLHSLGQKEANYTIPENLKAGMPLFSSSSSDPSAISLNIGSSSPAITQFAAFWKPIYMLNANIWQKWLHPHRIGLVLASDDTPKTNHHLPNNIGRYGQVQARQALHHLHDVLKAYCSFVLLENYAYIKFLYYSGETEKTPPSSFFIIRIHSKPPCIVIRLAFLGGTPGYLRNEVVTDLQSKILQPKPPIKRVARDNNAYQQVESVKSCLILRKPVEKILVRYERLPTDYTKMRGDLNRPFVTLGRYLLHRRWIWAMQPSPSATIPLKSVARILSTLTKRRLHEGFYFAHSSMGIYNLVKEIPMTFPYASGKDEETHPCVVQFLLFPHHASISHKDSVSEEEDTEGDLPESDGELQIITECWIEPQTGEVSPDATPFFLRKLTAQDIAQAFYPIDKEIIFTLLTLEHLCLLCLQASELPSAPAVGGGGVPDTPHQQDCVTEDTSSFSATLDSSPPPLNTSFTLSQTASNISAIQFAFNVPGLLPKSQQAELLFSTLIQDVFLEPPQSVVGASGSSPNEIFFEYFLDAIKLIHHREIILTARECNLFLKQVAERPRNHPLPFLHDPNRWEDNVLSSDSEPTPWRCFAKAMSPSHLILTFVPASYATLQKPIISRNATLSQLQDELPRLLQMVKSTQKPEVAEVQSSLLPTQEEDSPKKASLTLPVYCYECVMSQVTHHLVHLGEVKPWADLYQDVTIRFEEPTSSKAPSSTGSPQRTVLSLSAEVPFPPNAHYSPEAHSDESEVGQHHHQLRKHTRLIEAYYNRSFVYTIFKCLQLHYPMEHQDVEAAIDMCEESLLEIDITKFIQMVCLEMKDLFCTSPFDESDSKENDNERCLSAPLATLLSGDRCSESSSQQAIHSSIKSRFLNILHNSFKAIPSRPVSRYFFCPPHFQNPQPVTTEKPEKEEKELPLENEDAIDGISNSKVPAPNDDLGGSLVGPPESTQVALSPVHRQGGESSDPEGGTLHDRDTLSSLFHDDIDLEAVEEDEAASGLPSDIPPIPPLFLHLVCSVRLTSHHGTETCPQSIPVCFRELTTCFKNFEPEDGTISLSDLSVTLDVICLSLPQEVESPTIPPPRDRPSASFCSAASPVQEVIGGSERGSLSPPLPLESGEHSSYSLGPVPDVLDHLPDFQHQAVTNCIERIKWLLQDEVVTSARTLKPLSEATLDMVSNHVKTSAPSVCCHHEDVPLQFVFGNSLESFTQEFKQMSLPYYRLIEVGRYYCLVMNVEPSPDSKKTATAAAVGRARQSIIVSGLPHADDAMHLKKISNAEPTSFLLHRRPSDTSLGADDSTQIMGLPKTSEAALSTILSEKIKKAASGHPAEDDTETEDTATGPTKDSKQHGKFRINKKSVSSKHSRTSSTCKPDEDISNLQASSSSLPLDLPEKSSWKESSPQSHSVPTGFPRFLQNLAELANSQTTPGTPNQSLIQSPIHKAANITPISQGTGTPLESPPYNISDPSKIQESSTPATMISEAEFSSFIGSGHVSTNEDGYEGDTDGESEWEKMSPVDSRAPSLPPFWLLFQVKSDSVSVFFHVRNREEVDEEVRHGREILSQTITIIQAICKTVNQKLLLQSLHETRMCNQLLVAEANEDIWSNEPEHFKNITTDEYDQNTGEYLEATLKFMPGTFHCDCVWQTYFPLHPRLVASPGRTAVSLGIKALRTVLDPFSVNNRKNMFVYQEYNTNSVFYLRLYEIHMPSPNEGSKLDDTSSITGSCYSGIFGSKNGEDDSFTSQEFRSRLPSNLSDREQEGTKNQPCILLQVHGIGEVGNDIKEELVKALQNRLDDAVLESILVMFSRNPHCKLKPDDVQFIQKPGKEPNHVIHFKVQLSSLPLLPAIAVYIRQNMLSYLYTPKYVDPRPSTHFKAYGANVQAKEEDVFLYYRQQASGTSGNKGLACIIFLVVDSQGKPVQSMSCQLPAPQAYRDSLADYEYEELTFVHLFEPQDDAQTPGPLALLQFQVWCVGRIDATHLRQKLQETVRHALWDVVLEYRLLTAPFTDPLATLASTAASISEPSTPTKATTRRTGRVMVEYSEELLRRLSREHSSSVPDIGASLATSPNSLLQHHSSEIPTALPNPHQGEAPNGITEEGVLVSIFQKPLNRFFDFGLENLNYPNLTKHTFSLTSRHSLPFVVKEFQNLIHTLSPDLTVKVFHKLMEQKEGSEFVSLSTAALAATTKEGPYKENLPGQHQSFIVVGRNVDQWRTYMGHPDFNGQVEHFAQPPKNQKSQQKHLPVIILPERQHESTPSSPNAVRPPPFPIPLSAPICGPSGMVHRTSSTGFMENRTGNFVPRQILLLLYATDKQLVLYLYNWCEDMRSEIVRRCKKLVHWHTSRSLLLRTLVAHKLGLFHNGALTRHHSTSKGKEHRGGAAGPLDPGGTTLPLLPKTRGHFEQLALCHSPGVQPPHTQYLGDAIQTANLPISFGDLLKEKYPTHPLHHPTVSGAFRLRFPADLVAQHGLQVLKVLSTQRRDLQALYQIWQSRSTLLNVPYVDKTLQMAKKVARLSHFCLTPILFSPVWRSKLAPVRDHTLEPLINDLAHTAVAASESSAPSTRSRHSSSSSTKNQEVFRSRKNSSATTKQRRQNEAWSHDICANYMQEFLPYLQSLGFVAVQTSRATNAATAKSRRTAGSNEELDEMVRGIANAGGTYSLPYPRSSTPALPVFYLVKLCLGGLLVLEVGFERPYAYTHLYSLEGSRLEASALLAAPGPSTTLQKSLHFAMSFVDEVDKVKSSIHMHSFTFDYHLRTIFNYISGRQLIFRQGYHLTSFLNDFLNYYQKSPSYAGNVIFSGTIVVNHVPMAADQLFNYIINHNQQYGMGVMRMDPIFSSEDELAMTDYVTVELSTQKIQYKDTASDTCKQNHFDLGLLVSHAPLPAGEEDLGPEQHSLSTTSMSLSEMNGTETLVLRYYILLISQRELYPTPLGPAERGFFKPVRLGTMFTSSSGQSSRKISTSSLPSHLLDGSSSGPEDQSNTLQSGAAAGYKASGGSSIESSYGGPATTTTLSKLCNEEVTYLGFFSSQETVMQRLLEEQLLASQHNIRRMVAQAARDCRRDFLWAHLVPSPSQTKVSLGFSEFEELLTLVSVVPLVDRDPSLRPFLHMPTPWYSSLARELAQHYPDSYHTYQSPDGLLNHAVVSQPHCPCCFIMLSFDLRERPMMSQQPYFDNKFNIVFREPFTGFSKMANRQDVLTLIEDLVNRCCYHLWTGLLVG